MLTKFTLEDYAYSQAAGMFLCDLDEHNSMLNAYEHLHDCVVNGIEPENLSVWQPFEGTDWKDLLELIDNEGTSLHSNYKFVFEKIKQGIVHQAIEGDLDSDFNSLCLESMFELGSKLKNENSEA